MRELPNAIRDVLRERTEIVSNPLAEALARHAIAGSRSHTPLGIALAASFDLLVACKYYKHTKPEGWLWCEWSGLDFYPMQNACPFCSLRNRFIHHDGRKPGSGQIGPATASALRELLAAYYGLQQETDIEIWCGSEPVDLAIVDHRQGHIFIAEVKAAPLFTPPLCREHDPRSMDTVENAAMRHSRGISRRLEDADIMLFFPEPTGEHFVATVPSGEISDGFAFDAAVARIVAGNPELIDRYYSAWNEMWAAYCGRTRQSHVFWFTGGCGLPSDPGEGWPRTSGGQPKGSISDGKTSVGLDRTDDIKKATYQALSLGVGKRPLDLGGWKLRIGLASNVHAARHYAKYLEPIHDVVWSSGDVTDSSELYNLFDGIVSFTRSHSRDEWLTQLLEWHEG